MDSISIVPLTQSQFECRKTVSPLPTFNGQPTRYFYFIAAYKDSALKCGFSATENLQRISDALQPPARNTVKHLLCRPNKLSKVLSLLEDNFGRPELMVQYAEDLARKMHSLCENLENISEFYAEVMTMQDALELMGDGHGYGSLVEGIIWSKLSLQQGREWLMFRG